MYRYFYIVCGCLWWSLWVRKVPAVSEGSISIYLRSRSCVRHSFNRLFQPVVRWVILCKWGFKMTTILWIYCRVQWLRNFDNQSTFDEFTAKSIMVPFSTQSVWSIIHFLMHPVACWCTVNTFLPRENHQSHAWFNSLIIDSHIGRTIQHQTFALI